MVLSCTGPTKCAITRADVEVKVRDTCVFRCTCIIHARGNLGGYYGAGLTWHDLGANVHML